MEFPLLTLCLLTFYLSYNIPRQLSFDFFLASRSPTLTIFSPSDFGSGQPSLPILLYHVSAFPFGSTPLDSLPVGFKIPTLLPSHYLVVTSNNATTLSINGVQVHHQVPIFDNGFLVFLGIERLFDPGFEAGIAGQVAVADDGNADG